MGYVMFRIADEMRLIAKLRDVRNDLIGYEWIRISHFYRPYYVHTYSTSYITAYYIANNVDRFDDVWEKARFTKDTYEYGSCYIKITEDTEIEFEFNEDESIELENGGGVLAHGIFQINER